MSKIKQDAHCMFTLRSAENGIFLTGRKTGKVGYEPDFFLVFPSVKAALRYLEKKTVETFQVKEASVKKKKRAKK